MYFFPFFTSLFFILAAGIIFHKAKYSFAGATNFCLFAVLAFGLNFFYLICDRLTGRGINEAVAYHFIFGLKDAEFSNYKNLLVASGVFIVFLTLFLWLVLRKSHKKEILEINPVTPFLFLFLALLLSPATPDLSKLYSIYYQPSSFLNASNNASAHTNTEQSELANEFYNLYGKTLIQKIGENKNFVFIYLEGLESTYSDEIKFPGLTKNLNNLKSRSIYFTNLGQSYGADFTIAGMVASQCGIPLFSPSHGNTMSGVDKYLPSAFCISDFLHKEGYYLAEIASSLISFAGKNLFLETHKFDELQGSGELSELLGEPLNTGWGGYDDSMFNFVYERFLSLSSLNKKFGIFSATMDTHFQDGGPSQSCKDIKYGDGKNKTLNNILCTDYLTGNFVNKILSSPYADNTVIIIASDHLALPNDVTDRLNEQERKNRLMIISPDYPQGRETAKSGSTLDIASTMLPFLGYSGDIGLGRNLLDNNQSEDELKFIRDNLENWRPQILSFWDFPKIEDHIEINIPDQCVIINKRKFAIPALIDISLNMETSIKFQFDVPEELGLNSQIKSTDENYSFMLVDECKKINELYSEAGDKGFCLLAGRGKKYSVVLLKDKESNFFDVETIKRMTYLNF